MVILTDSGTSRHRVSASFSFPAWDAEVGKISQSVLRLAERAIGRFLWSNAI